MLHHPLALFIISAAAYLVTGLLGLQLAIPPGFASAVWPAAGVALALMYLSGGHKAVLAGILSGSFLTNITVSTGWFAVVTFSNLWPPLLIASGATLQAFVGYRVLKRFDKDESIPDVPRSIVFFALVIALGSPLINSGIGSLTLLLAGFISVDMLAFSWLTWWVGDAIGLFLFTPLIIILLQPGIQMRRRLQVAIPTTILFSLVISLFFLSMNYYREKQQAAFDQLAERTGQRINEALRLSEKKLISYSALFNASEKVTRTEFENFSAIISGSDKTLYGIGWTPVISNDQRPQFEQRIRKEYPGFSLKELNQLGDLVPASERELYYPVMYIYPYERNKAAIGLNLGANQSRRDALMQARILNQPVATAPIILAQETDNQKAIILYMPVFTEGDINKEFLGYASAVIRVSNMLEEVIDEFHSSGVSLRIYDATESHTPQPLSISEEPENIQYQHYDYSAQFGTRSYDIDMYANNYIQSENKDWGSWLIITGGFLLAALFQVFILLITGTVQHVRRQVELKTQELTLAMNKANAANEAKSRFLANMSHELRTPMNAIIGFINLCLKTVLSEKQRDYLEKSHLASTTLLALINESLDYAKIEAGHLELTEEDFPLDSFLRKLHALFDLKAEEKGLTFEINTDEEVPARIIADELRLEQIFLNLLSNAFKFTEQGGITLHLSYNPKEQQLSASVTDTGIGIDQKHIPHLFEAFRQAESSTNRRFGGTGLGLSISHELVLLMQGDIHIQSEPGKGSCFTVTVKVCASGEEKLEWKEEEQLIDYTNLVTPESGFPLQNIHCLLVEDVMLNQILAEELLIQMGAEVTIAENGLDALDKLRDGLRPDVILMDLQMPVMDGFEATRQIQEMPELNHIPVLAMTANAMDTDVKTCREAGMKYHISKPLDAMDILCKIQAALND